MGSDGTGSTSSTLPGSGGGGGGGGGGGDFGAVLQNLVPAGALVKKGDQLAEFDRQYMLQRVDDYESGVLQQELNLKNQQASLEVTRKAHDQSIQSAKAAVEKAELDLKTVPVRSAIDSERFKLALEEAQARYKQVLAEVPYVDAGEKAQLRISELDIEQAKIEWKRAQTNAERMVMRSPMGGMAVMMRMFRGGEFGQVQSGDPIPPGFPFMQVVDNSSMVVNAFVNQVDVEKMRVGQKATIRFDAFPELALPGHVFSIAAMPKSTFSARASYLKEIPVLLKIDKMDPRVIPDLSVSAEVILGEEDAQTVVSAAAVFHDSDAKKAFVFVKQEKGWERRNVETGLANATHIVVRSGLKAGESVAEEKPETVNQTSAGLRSRDREEAFRLSRVVAPRKEEGPQVRG